MHDLQNIPTKISGRKAKNKMGLVTAFILVSTSTFLQGKTVEKLKTVNTLPSSVGSTREVGSCSNLVVLITLNSSPSFQYGDALNAVKTATAQSPNIAWRGNVFYATKDFVQMTATVHQRNGVV